MKIKLKLQKFIKKIFSPSVKVYELSKKNVDHSIRLQLVLVFGLCLIISVFFMKIVGNFMNNSPRNARIDYSAGIKHISDTAYEISSFFKEQKVSKNDSSKINTVVKIQDQDSSIKVLICDLEGNVLYHSSNAAEKKIDVYSILKNVMDRDDKVHYKNGKGVIVYENKEYDSLYPISFTDGYGYVVVKGIPYGTVVYDKYDNSLLAVLFAFAAFIISFYFITSRKMQYIESVSSGLYEISKGNLDYRIKKVGNDEIASLADNINDMAEKLKNKIDKERQIEKTKNDLITNVSHDLRTPLSYIKGYSEAMIEGVVTEEEQKKKYLRLIHREAGRLQRLVHDLLDLAQLEGDSYPLNLMPLSLAQLIEDTMGKYEPFLQEKKIGLILDLDFDVIVFADEDRLEQVITNIVDNAIRYSPENGELKMVLTQRNNTCTLTISDTGEGIPPEELQRLGERFYRVDKSRTRKKGGSGLGLSIVKQIVFLHKGTIHIDSVLGKGTDVSVTLPLYDVNVAD
ncbi:MAG TPA: two-component sensor histidine kinase [Paenibacillaceae bacterium]|nr:two-component sensor histidine kinase [Paenibacillaceae bacterium]